MAIETFEFIDDLNAANPTATDNVSEGDDHLRGLKTTLKNTFPNVTGAITATETELNILDGVTSTTAELNYVDGVTSNIQTQLDNIDTDLLNDTTPQLGGNLDTQTFTVDGRDVSTDGSKLDLIEASANNYAHPTGAGNNHIPTGGTVGQLLTNTASGTGTWQAAPGGGKVLQITSSETQSTYSSSSSTFSDMFSGTITPSSTTSKILVTVNVASCHGYGTPDKHLEMELHRDGTRAYGLSQYTGGNPSGSGGATGVGSVTLCVLDSPATTSPITYKLRMRSRAGNAYVRANSYYSANSTSSIVLTEIGV